MTNATRIPPELVAAANPVIDEDMENLRAACEEVLADDSFHLDQLLEIVLGLQALRSLSEIAEATNLSETRVLDAVAKLGSWLSKGHGAAATDVVLSEEVGQQQLMNFPPAPLGKGKAAREASARNAPAARKSKIIIPPGFDPATTKRDLRKSLGAIVSARPNASELNRFVARGEGTHKEVTFELIAAVWYFARLDRLGEIKDVNEKSREFQLCVVAAFDLLEVARRDGMAALVTLLSGSEDYDAYADAVVKARPLFQAEATRVERLVELARTSNQAAGHLRKELGFLARRIEAAPKAFVISSIADLNEGQVRRITGAAGLDVEANHRAEENHVRRRLQEMGLDNDVDRLLSAGVRAIQSGVEDLFWAACERYQAGDADWHSDLRAALEESVAA